MIGKRLIVVVLIVYLANRNYHLIDIQDIPKETPVVIHKTELNLDSLIHPPDYSKINSLLPKYSDIKVVEINQ